MSTSCLPKEEVSSTLSSDSNIYQIRDMYQIREISGRGGGLALDTPIHIHTFRNTKLHVKVETANRPLADDFTKVALDRGHFAILAPKAPQSGDDVKLRSRAALVL